MRGFPGRRAPAAHLLRSLSSNFSDRGCRRPPRSRGLDSGDLWKRNAAVQPTHTTPISRYRQHMSTIVKHLFRSGSKKCSPPHRNPCSRSFGTTVHDQWNCCSRRTLRLRVAFDPPLSDRAGAQVIPVVRLDVLLVQFGKHGLEITKAADRAVILVVAPGRVLANTSQQDNSCLSGCFSKAHSLGVAQSGDRYPLREPETTG